MDELTQVITVDEPGVYQIKVQGRLRPQWSTWFDGMEIATEVQESGPTVTILSGYIADQAALHGILARIRDLGLPLLLVQLLAAGGEPDEKHEV